MVINYFICVPDLGICTADLSTPNQYASVWAGLFTIITFVLPFGICLGGLCVVYLRGIGQVLSSTRHFTDQLLHYTNITCTIAMITCALNLFYFSVILSTADGIDSGTNLVFWATFLLSTKSFVYVLTLRISANTNNCQCSYATKWCSRFRKNPGTMGYELSDLEVRRSLTQNKADGSV